jgi:hypothetical protein
MNISLLKEDEVQQVHSIMAQHGIEQFDASVRFWGRGKSISVDGLLGEKHLTCLLDIARALGPNTTTTTLVS